MAVAAQQVLLQQAMKHEDEKEEDFPDNESNFEIPEQNKDRQHHHGHHHHFFDSLLQDNTDEHDIIDLNHLDDHHKHDEDEESQRPPPTIRERIFSTLDDPCYSQVAMYIFCTMFVVVIVAAVCFCLLSYPQYHNENVPTGLYATEIICNTLFTIEYFAKLVTVKKPWRWAIRPLSLVDFLAIIPTYVDLILRNSVASELGGLAVVRVVRIFRFLRIFRISKLAKKSPAFLILYVTATRSKAAIVATFSMMGAAVLVFSALLFYAEQMDSEFLDGVWHRKADGEVSPFQSIPHTFWWCIVTLTGTGYGDAYPLSVQGRIVAGIAMVCGLLSISFPISLIGAEFSRVWQKYAIKEAMDEKEKEKDEKKKKLDVKDTLIILRNSCHRMDRDIVDIKRKQDRVLFLIRMLEKQMVPPNVKPGTKQHGFVVGNPMNMSGTFGHSSSHHVYHHHGGAGGGHHDYHPHLHLRNSGHHHLRTPLRRSQNYSRSHQEVPGIDSHAAPHPPLPNDGVSHHYYYYGKSPNQSEDVSRNVSHDDVTALERNHPPPSHNFMQRSRLGTDRHEFVPVVNPSNSADPSVSPPPLTDGTVTPATPNTKADETSENSTKNTSAASFAFNLRKKLSTSLLDAKRKKKMKNEKKKKEKGKKELQEETIHPNNQKEETRNQKEEGKVDLPKIEISEPSTTSPTGSESKREKTAEPSVRSFQESLEMSTFNERSDKKEAQEVTADENESKLSRQSKEEEDKT